MPRAEYVPKHKFKEANTEAEMKEMFEDIHKGGVQRNQKIVNSINEGVKHLKLYDYVKEKYKELSNPEKLKLFKLIDSGDIMSEADIDKHIKHSKPSKKSPLDLLKEAREDGLISKKEYDLLKDMTPSKIKSRLKSLDVQDLSDDEEIEKYKPDLSIYEGVKKTKGRPKKEKVVKEKLKPVTLKLIGHELNTRTRKEKMSPEKKREVYDFIMKF